MNFKAIVFDLDGTLVNSTLDYADAANDVLNSYDFPTHSLEAYERFIGYGIEAFVSSILPDCYEPGSKVFEKCLREFRRRYTTNCCVYTTLYEGIVDMLDNLHNRQVSLNVLTNKPHDLALKVVDAYLSQYTFDYVIGYKAPYRLKPQPDAALSIARNLRVLPGEIVFVGDTPADMYTAQNAGMFPLGVAWGFRARQDLLQAGAKAIVSTPQQICEFVGEAKVLA